MNKHLEIEVRFLEIDTKELILKLQKYGARDLGEDVLREVIFYDSEKTWLDQQRFVRLRTDRKGTKLSYKHQFSCDAAGTKVIEFEVSDPEKMKYFLHEIGIEAFRIQEKKRRTFNLDGVTIDIDTWPKIPPYAEFEGENEKILKNITKKLGFDWKDAVFENAKIVIEKHYHLPISTYKYFTFGIYG